MDVFALRDAVIHDYARYIDSFIRIRDVRVRARVQDELAAGRLWPEPLIQMNPSFAPGASVENLVATGVLHPACAQIFRIKPDSHSAGMPLALYRHQEEAVQAARAGNNYVLTTGTGSGKSLAYLVPIVDRVLREGSGQGIRAIIVYPMNALANSQYEELTKYLKHGFPEGHEPVTFARYTGQDDRATRDRIIEHPPDILLTNYVMLELLLTRPEERRLIEAAHGLRFLVLDEIHTYRGRQGADVALLVRRTREAMHATAMQCAGTSATLAAGGTWEDQQQEIARVASLLFGVPVRPEDVIGETLRRATDPLNPDDSADAAALTKRITAGANSPTTSQATDPLARWIENTFGVRERAGRLVRQTPRALGGVDGAAARLHALTGIPVNSCAAALREALLAGYRRDAAVPGAPPFAFRLHQFISRGDTVYASPEPEASRHLTLSGQRFVPGDRSRVLLPLVFCRECGQAYYGVWGQRDDDGKWGFAPREISDRVSDNGETAGFLYLSGDDPWPADDDIATVCERLPEEWTEEGAKGTRVRTDHRKHVPQTIFVGTDGRETTGGARMQWVTAPFRFCLHCGVTYDARQRSDFPKLATLSSEGRSTATTVLSLSTVRRLRGDDSMPASARKLLSFTDNRQDASLQAGHFNDFVGVGVLRGALYRAAAETGGGMRYDDLTRRVFDALDLPMGEYAQEPDVLFMAREETQQALRDVLGYRLYLDLRRGWRVTAPNLEQSGLLVIDYADLDTLANMEEMWATGHQALATATPSTRATIARALLDVLRRALIIRVDYLTRGYQESMRARSNQRLVGAWALDPDERLEYAGVAYPRSRRPSEQKDGVFVSARSGFGQFLRRPGTLPDAGGTLSIAETETVIRDLFAVLRRAGLVTEVVAAERAQDVPGYQVPAAALRWVAGDGLTPYRDPIRTTRASTADMQTNDFFRDFYVTVAASLGGMEAREHTAQVQAKVREQREHEFRAGTLPVLYCSPTMELGIDIADLNVVNLRNVPPTPANYAQRSGRAGRSGQPALVFTYCSTGNSHDQYFFARPTQMVAGAVAPPRLDLANEDLIRAHVDAIWLAKSRLALGTSLKDVLDVDGEEPTLALKESVRERLGYLPARAAARVEADRIFSTLPPEVTDADWYYADWLNDTLGTVEHRFEAACDRWRSLYRAALGQAKTQDAVIRDASRDARDKEQARRLRREAEAQLQLLADDGNLAQSDFYSYRYFASEGFLPGYSFPRLPVAAYVPAQGRARGRDEFLSRPRFLAISEFGPRATIYHEGARYLIHKVILPVDTEDGVLTRRAKRCPDCGYLHPVTEGDGPDLCERCHTLLDPPITGLFRLQNVATRRRDRITSDEEERFRLGYEIVTALRFAEREGVAAVRHAAMRGEDGPLARLSYGHAATIWRINMGWRRRQDRHRLGFILDTERGYWARNELDDTDGDDDPMSGSRTRVIPFVEDRRNCIVLEPSANLTASQMASVQAALGGAIRTRYQLEERELEAEPLPRADERRMILLYESAEGGAGVLRRLLNDPQAFGIVARTALEICHFDPDTGEDLRHAPHATEECEAACYDCLMSYQNQRDHVDLDRHAIRDILLSWTRATVELSPVEASRGDHLAHLERQAGSELERRWLRHLESHGHRLPDSAQRLIPECTTRPDFFYDAGLAVYVDGPPHQFPERQARDATQTTCLEDCGYLVVRFGEHDDWDELLSRYPNVFGSTQVTIPTASARSELPGDQWDLYDRRLVPLLKCLADEGMEIMPGVDVTGADGEIAGATIARVSRDGQEWWLLDAAEVPAVNTIELVAPPGVVCVRVPLDSDNVALSAAVRGIGGGAA